MHANRFFQTVYILVNTLDLIDRDIFSIPDDSIRTPLDHDLESVLLHRMAQRHLRLIP